MVKINRKWAVVTCLMALLIWGNSLVPGSGSGSLSLTVMEAIRGFLHGVGLPYEWVTNFVVRKCAHFTEYMVLGILATHAFDFEGRRTFDVLLPQLMTDEKLTREDLIRLGDGGFCQSCQSCHWPNCTFGRY